MLNVIGLDNLMYILVNVLANKEEATKLVQNVVFESNIFFGWLYFMLTCNGLQSMLDCVTISKNRSSCYTHFMEPTIYLLFLS